jgi:ArsR family transcriptional regulator, lead/cadmium/zinc/bismuth-responsive transcriptional repressor
MKSGLQLKERDPVDLPGCTGSDHREGRGPLPFSDLALERAARIFRAAGDAARLRLLDQLLEGERCVTELADSVGANLSTVSQQLRTLRSEELVLTRREGKHVYYSLADQHVADLITNVLAHAREGGQAMRKENLE